MPFEIPESWEWCKVRDFSYVASGSTPDKSAFVDDGIPFLKMYNLKNQSIDFDYKPQYIKEEIHNGKLQRSRTEVGDLIMNIVGPPLGKLAIIPPSLPQSNFNQAAVLIRPILQKDTLVRYLFYYLSQMSEINSIQTRGNAGQNNISLTQCQNIRVSMPPLSEQKRIVAEIEKWFALIDDVESNKQDLLDFIKAAKSKIISLAISGKLVPQDPNDQPAIDLLHGINPNFKSSDNSHYENIPQGWAISTVGEVANYMNGRAFKPTEWELEGLPIIRIQNLNDCKASYNYTTVTYEDKYLIKDGDLLFAWAASLGTYIWNGSNAWLNQHIFKVEPKEYMDKSFLYYSFVYLISEFYRQSHGSGMVHITKGKFENTPILIPPLTEQKRIVTALEEIINLIDTIGAEL